MQDESRTADANSKSVPLRLKVSEKGALSVYGMGRFPVTLYKEQWKRLLDAGAEIRAFLQEHDGELKSKGAPAEDKAEQPEPAGV
jgi:hypothetical protein